MTEILHFDDPLGACSGWLDYDERTAPLAAGGCRAKPGLTAEGLAVLAGRMTLKQRILGVNVDGAKCGLDIDPHADGAGAALGRFLAFLRDELTERFSMGPDMGTDWDELQRIAAAVGVPSTKYAVRSAQRLSDVEFFARMARLGDQVGLMTLSQRRAGHAVGHAVIAAAAATEARGPVKVAMQGFGNLGRAAACTLLEENVRLVAVADEYGCVVDRAGLDIAAMLTDPPGTPVPMLRTDGLRLPPTMVFEQTADVLVLAACADAMRPEHTAGPQFGSVVVGANCGLTENAEDTLHDKGVFVVPDFIGGIGGSASMEALFGPRRVPTARQVLSNLAGMMRDLVGEIATASRRDNITPRETALRMAATTTVDPAAPPYGQCPYLATTTH